MYSYEVCEKSTRKVLIKQDISFIEPTLFLRFSRHSHRRYAHTILATQTSRRTSRSANSIPASPCATVCVWALAADTEEQAWHLFKSRARWRMDRNLGRIGPILPPDEAERDYSPAEQLALAQLKANALVGSAPQVASKLRALAQRMDLDEIVLITWTHDPVHQRRSYELLAQEFAWGQQASSRQLEPALN